jgi:hypothetical protein
MSDHTLSRLQPSTLKRFAQWHRDFEKQKRIPHVLRAFVNLTKGQVGCEKEELNWALFYAAMSLETLEEPERFRDFFLLLDDVLIKILDLADALVALLDLPPRSGAGLGGHLALFGDAEKAAKFILKFPPELAVLYRLLDRIREIGATPRTYGPYIAALAENLLWVYVQKATKPKPSIRQVSVLLEAACLAYGLEEGGRDFGEEAFGKRLGQIGRAHV